MDEKHGDGGEFNQDLFDTDDDKREESKLYADGSDSDGDVAQAPPSEVASGNEGLRKNRNCVTLRTNALWRTRSLS